MRSIASASRSASSAASIPLKRETDSSEARVFGDIQDSPQITLNQLQLRWL
jgi:hypothetical protein